MADENPRGQEREAGGREGPTSDARPLTPDLDAQGGTDGDRAVARALEQVRELVAERDRLRGHVGELEGRTALLQGEAETARSAAGAAQAESLVHLRRALLAESSGRVVPELVTGDTAEALQASLDVAKAAFARATDAARAHLEAERVPAGTPTRDALAGGSEPLSPIDRIARGLERRQTSES